MKLYMFPVAPNPTRVRIQLAEKGVEIEQVLVDLRAGEQKKPEHLARNPLGKLPVLELDDGSFLSESLAIMELIEELHPNPPMIGLDPISRARVRAAHRNAESALASIAMLVHATNSPLGLPPDPAVAEFGRCALPPLLELLDDRIGEHPFVAGDDPTIADCTLFAAFNFGRFFGVSLDPKFAHLTRWFADYEKRPTVQSALTLPGKIT